MRYPATQGQRDSNEAEIIAALEAVGATVEQIPTGGGVPDLLVGYRFRNYLLEVKRQPIKGKVKPSEVRLNPTQRRWFVMWAGHCEVVRTPEEALAVLGIET